MAGVAKANRYVDAAAPWALKKTDPVRMAEVLAVLAETIRQIAILTQPVMPHSAGLIWTSSALIMPNGIFVLYQAKSDLPAGIRLTSHHLSFRVI